MKYWLVKGSPKRYDLDEAVQLGLVETWETRKPPRDWRVGDRLFFWSSAPRLHLVAIGSLCGVVGKPTRDGQTLYSVEYLTDPLPNRVGQDRLRADPICAGATFLKPAVAQGVLEVSTSEAHQMYRLLRAANLGMADRWPDIPQVDNTAKVEAQTLASAPVSSTQPVPSNWSFDQLADLEAERTFAVRREQQMIRQLLLNGQSTGGCCICGESLPAELLIAAHIKPRRLCTDAEKRDARHNTALMCTLGCDALFERGFIGVKEGRVCTGPVASPVVAVQRSV